MAEEKYTCKHCGFPTRDRNIIVEHLSNCSNKKYNDFEAALNNEKPMFFSVKVEGTIRESYFCYDSHIFGDHTIYISY